MCVGENKGAAIARAEKVAFVQGDNDVVFMDVARAIDILRGSGVDKVGLITGLN